jgi:hypothetical protein
VSTLVQSARIDGAGYKEVSIPVTSALECWNQEQTSARQIRHTPHLIQDNLWLAYHVVGTGHTCTDRIRQPRRNTLTKGGLGCRVRAGSLGNLQGPTLHTTFGRSSSCLANFKAMPRNPEPRCYIHCAVLRASWPPCTRQQGPAITKCMVSEIFTNNRGSCFSHWHVACMTR